MTLLVVILLVFLLVGVPAGPVYTRYPAAGPGIVWVILLILLVLMLVGGGPIVINR